MSDNMPFEIQVEIMERLPVKSLIRFRCVSKPWKSIIDGSKFINDHTANHTHPHHLLVRYHSDDLKYVSIPDNNDNGSFPQHKFPINVPESVKLMTPNLTSKPNLLGSSHGLFCFYNFYESGTRRGTLNKTVVVWNPSIRKSVTIVVPNVLKYPYETVIGFGVCPRTFHFKLIKVSFNHSPYEIENCIPNQVEVFSSSSSGGVWRSPLCIKNLPRKTITLDSELDQVEIDGVIYWLAYDNKTDDDYDTRPWDDLIMSFDLTNEEFTEIYLPDDLTRSAFDLHISKLKGSVVVLEVDTRVVKRVFDVWKMEHGGVSKTFSKLYTINKPEAWILRVLAFRKSGEPIIEREIDSEDENALFVYDHNSKLINDTGIYGKEDLFSAISYVETLLLLDY